MGVTPPRVLAHTSAWVASEGVKSGVWEMWTSRWAKSSGQFDPSAVVP